MCLHKLESADEHIFNKVNREHNHGDRNSLLKKIITILYDEKTII